MAQLISTKRSRPSKGYYALMSRGEVAPHRLTDMDEDREEVQRYTYA